MSMMPLRRLLATAIICILSSLREAAAQTCSEMTVTGGASPGTYLITDDIVEDRNVYSMTEDGVVVAIFRFFEGSVRRRLEEGFEGLDAGMAARKALEGLSGPSRGGPSLGVAGEMAEAVLGRSLDECATGFWANVEGYGQSSTSTTDPTYPVFVAADCADDPSEVTAEWLSVACSSCELEPDEITITCNATSSADSSVEGADAEDSASTVGAGGGILLAALTAAFVAHTGAFFLR